MQAQTVKEKIRSQYKWMKLIISKHGKKCSYDKMETSTLFGWPSCFDSENDEPLKQQRKRKREEEKTLRNEANWSTFSLLIDSDWLTEKKNWFKNPPWSCGLIAIIVRSWIIVIEFWMMSKKERYSCTQSRSGVKF